MTNLIESPNDSELDEDKLKKRNKKEKEHTKEKRVRPVWR